MLKTKCPAFTELFWISVCVTGFNTLKLTQFKGRIMCNILPCTCMVWYIAQRCPLLQVSMVSLSNNFSFTSHNRVENETFYVKNAQEKRQDMFVYPLLRQLSDNRQFSESSYEKYYHLSDYTKEFNGQLSA